MKKVSKAAKVAGMGVVLLLGCALALGQTTTAQKTIHHKKTASKTSAASAKTHGSKGKKGKKTASWKRHGQQKIDPQRAREIQEALIREHYMDGKASGTWDDTSQKAMEKFQSDNGWQSKMIPDSRALIKLGLGPDHQHLLNPESAMTTAPAVGSARSRGDASSTPPQK